MAQPMDGPRARNQIRVRYESVEGEFVAMLTCDDDALAIDYPAIARRLATQTQDQPEAVRRLGRAPT